MEMHMEKPYNHMDRDRDTETETDTTPVFQLRPAFQLPLPQHLAWEGTILEVPVESRSQVTANPADIGGAEEPSC